MLTALRTAMATPDSDPAAISLLAHLLVPTLDAYATALDRQQAAARAVEAASVEEATADTEWDTALDRLTWGLRGADGAPIPLSTLVGLSPARARQLKPVDAVELAQRLDHALSLRPDISTNPADREALERATTRLQAATTARGTAYRNRIAATMELDAQNLLFDPAISSAARTLRITFGDATVARLFPKFY